MVNRKQAIEAIKKAKVVFVNTRLTEHDMAYTKGIKKDIISEINNYCDKHGIDEFNIFIDSDGDVVIG